MQSFTSLSLLLTLALSAFASPIEKRATISCESTPFVSNQHMTANTVDNIVFGLGNTTATDHLGNKAKVLISTKDDGSNITRSESTGFDFYSCNSTYMNTHPTGDAYTLLVYGVLKPSGQSKHCLQTQSGSVDTADQVMTNSLCSDAEDSTQQQQTWSYFPNDGFFSFISTRLGDNQKQHPTYFTRSNVNHHALKLNAGTSDADITLSLSPY